jgi:hypothetical protein
MIIGIFGVGVLVFVGLFISGEFLRESYRKKVNSTRKDQGAEIKEG